MGLTDVLVAGLAHIGQIKACIGIPRNGEVRCFGAFLKRSHVSHTVSQVDGLELPSMLAVSFVRELLHGWRGCIVDKNGWQFLSLGGHQAGCKLGSVVEFEPALACP